MVEGKINVVSEKRERIAYRSLVIHPSDLIKYPIVEGAWKFLVC
jgi:hypothetical protein